MPKHQNSSKYFRREKSELNYLTIHIQRHVSIQGSINVICDALLSMNTASWFFPKSNIEEKFIIRQADPWMETVDRFWRQKQEPNSSLNWRPRTGFNFLAARWPMDTTNSWLFLPGSLLNVPFSMNQPFVKLIFQNRCVNLKYLKMFLKWCANLIKIKLKLRYRASRNNLLRYSFSPFLCLLFYHKIPPLAGKWNFLYYFIIK